MSTDADRQLDDADLDNPWERMQRLGGALEIVAAEEDARKVTEARQLLQSLEARIKEDEGR